MRGFTGLCAWVKALQLGDLKKINEQQHVTRESSYAGKRKGRGRRREMRMDVQEITVRVRVKIFQSAGFAESAEFFNYAELLTLAVNLKTNVGAIEGRWWFTSGY